MQEIAYLKNKKKITGRLVPGPTRRQNFCFWCLVARLRRSDLIGPRLSFYESYAQRIYEYVLLHDGGFHMPTSFPEISGCDPAIFTP